MSTAFRVGNKFSWMMLFLFVAGTVLAGELPITTNSQKALKLFMDGRDKIYNIEFNVADKILSKAIEADPQFALAYLYRSMSAGSQTASLDFLNKAASMIDNVSAGEKHLITYFQARYRNDGTTMEKELKALLNDYGDDYTMQYLAGTHYDYVLRDNVKALEHYQKTARLRSDFAPVYNTLGYLNMRMERMEDAETAFKNYIKHNPKSPNPYDSYAEFLMKQGRFEESIAQYRKAYDTDKLYVNALNGIGDNYLLMGQFDKARQYYNSFLENGRVVGDKQTALFSLTKSYVFEGKTDKAVEACKRLGKYSHENGQEINVIYAKANAGNILTEAGKTNEGAKMYDDAETLINNSDLNKDDRSNLQFAAHLWKCYTQTTAGKYDWAQKELQACMEMAKIRNVARDMKRIHGLQAYMEVKRGNYKKALSHFDKCDLTNPVNLYYQAVALEKTGQQAQANKIFSKLAKWNSASFNYGLVYNRVMERSKSLPM